MTDKYGAYYRTIGIFLDLILLNLSGVIGYFIVLTFPESLDRPQISFLHIMLANVVWFNMAQVTGLYRNMFIKDAIPTIKEALGSLLLFGLVLVLLMVTVTELDVFSRTILLTFLLFAILFLTGKIGFLLWRRAWRAQLIDYKPVIIIGANTLGQELKKHMDGQMILGYKVVGFFDDNSPIDLKQPLLGNLDEAIVYAKKNRIKEVFCVLPDSCLPKIHSLMREADREMIRFKMVPDIQDYFKKNVTVQWFGHLPILSARTEPLEIKINQVLKRGFDLLISSLVIIFILSWVIPLLGLLIKLGSPGPVFFRQLRSGKDNEPFYCLKFRSMVVNAEADLVQATKKDDRITRLGAFIRKNSIDELPQFINVFLGEMSVVGPRPHMLQHTAEYSALIDQFMVRHLVLPGITGWAQVKGFRGQTIAQDSMEERVKADIWYLENWSLLLDMKIVFLTAWHVIIGNENAA
ncbi:UDP-phosphate glucose phosphotransferase [Pedobacter antarcticus 4BY]|uniref:UDP-phosphate glucose phosphotransferase n=2 Tax=Pedobacter antarcticus TaxID=34086 RepID=A0A081PG54_9SPHI|nr:undecaprenyl-phosphate glucose phosphotransferase [Pedobacter antarcticus]KEQ29677.1 UDP-phosphate glucose phosphotransferase [Pedobacter antarcticus 4BY]SFF13371.1 putative colanic acid biosysnthesis UDP-glucose lipid carrier transferase [Pedobacter antarcticus]